MPYLVQEDHPVTFTWSASGSFSVELSPKPYTITRMAVVGLLNLTNSNPLNDPFDRIISTMTLKGNGQNHFDFKTARNAHHFSRLAGFGLRRPTPATSSRLFYGTMFHFGVAPKLSRNLGLPNGECLVEDNPFDLTAGVPPSPKGTLTLDGTFGAATATGDGFSNIVSCTFYVHFWGVQQKAGDKPADYMPVGIPNWQNRTPTPTATSGLYATQDDVPGGDFLRDIMILTTNGTGAPRDDQVLDSLQLYNQLEARAIIQSARSEDLELLTQFGSELSRAPGDDNSTLGTPSVGPSHEFGLYWLPVHKFAPGGHPLFGADLRRVATGSLQLRYGVGDATGVTMEVVYRKYKLNPEHPSNR